MLLNLPINKEIKIWLYSLDCQLKPISNEESKWKKKISEKNYHRFHYSRGYIRYSLSKLFNVSPLDIPLKANPGEAPILKKGWGYLSLSHCKDAILIGWAPSPLGIDFEPQNRLFPAQKIFNRIMVDNEKDSIYCNSPIKFREEVLKHWIIKESSFKWQTKKENSDLFQWEWLKAKKYALNKKRKLKVKTYLIAYDSFFIGISYNDLQNKF